MSLGNADMKWAMPTKSRTSADKLNNFRKWLEDQGIRPSVRKTYLFRVEKYLKFTRTPSQESFDAFREQLRNKGLKRSTLNGYSIAVKAYHRSLGETVSYKFLKPNNVIPYYFTEAEVESIFACVENFKHFAMLSVLFYAALRVSELANLDVQDVDLDSRTISVRDGKGGRYGIAYISQDCASTLKDYLEVRKKLRTERDGPSLRSNDRRL
jgi:integrase/recombinase XerD